MFLSVYLKNWPISVAKRRLISADKSTCEMSSLRHGTKIALTRETKKSSEVIYSSDESNQLSIDYPLAVNNLSPSAETREISVANRLQLKGLNRSSPRLITLEYQPIEYITALEKLAVWFSKFSPLVGFENRLARAVRSKKYDQISPLDWGVIIDLRGTTRLHKSFQQLLSEIWKTLSLWDVQARLAIAPTLGAAWALSRFYRSNLAIFTLVDGNQLSEALSDLPLDALRLNPDTIESLKELGLSSIGLLRTVPSKTLSNRFGREIIDRLRELDNTSSSLFSSINQQRMPFLEEEFDPPITNHNALLLATEDLLSNLSAELKAQNLSSESLAITFFGTNREGKTLVAQKEISTLFQRDTNARFRSVVSALIEPINFPKGAYKIKVAAPFNKYRSSQQQSFMASSTTTHTAEEKESLVADLFLRCGYAAAHTTSTYSSNLPELSFRFIPIGSNSSNRSDNITIEKVSLSRPPILLKKPDRIDVRLNSSGVPSSIIWQGKAVNLLRVAGPEIISSNWWGSALQSILQIDQRYYFKTQCSNGTWIWIFNLPSSDSWFVHGFWS